MSAADGVIIVRLNCTLYFRCDIRTKAKKPGGKRCLTLSGDAKQRTNNLFVRGRAAPIIHFMYFFLCCWFFGLVDAPLNASVDVRVVGLIGCLVGLMTVFTRHLVISVPSEHVRSV